MKKAYTAKHVDKILPRLVDILSLEEGREGELSNWVKTQFPGEIRPLADVFDAATDTLHHKWAAAVLATLPEAAWEDGPCSLLRINAYTGLASMRFLSETVPSGDEAEAEILTKARAGLHQGLLAAMPAATRLHYKEMLTFYGTEQTQNPHSGDTHFGHLLFELEKAFDKLARRQEHQWRERTGFPEAESIPFSQRCECGHVAIRQMALFAEHSCRAKDGLETVPLSLLAVVSANISVNRALLELAAQDARGREAEAMCLPFLDALNAHGVVEVPFDIENASAQIVDEVLRQHLRCWFAHGGEFLQPGTAISRHMTNTEIDKIVVWSHELQSTYIDYQRLSQFCANPGASHEGHNNLFIFAMALAAAFYSDVTTAHVFKGRAKNASHAIFPSRKNIAEGHGMTVHARTVLMKAYGLIFFANRGWELRADRVKEYSLSAQVRRAQLQLLVNASVKQRDSRELLALVRWLKQLRTDPDGFVECIELLESREKEQVGVPSLYCQGKHLCGLPLVG